ncbi:acyltransferase family protein [Bacillus sp. FSL K6-3431]|uniref:acyltransferase family protein n=1 Tax=Bacillus sp. FSL K6-3431 TaxID=2921500 RepID=UPI0030F9818B
MNKKIINEVIWLRVVACISVVLGHSLITTNTILYEDVDSFGKKIVYLILMATYFATPVFIFISEFLLAKKYSNGLPPNFIKKRAKYLLVPYLFMSVVYGFVNADSLNPQSIMMTIIRNILLAESTVYFILIIFQFYFLHIVFYKKLNKWKPLTVISSTLLLNILYLSFFHFVNAPENEIASYIWRRGHWLLFVAWIFYFVMGFYIGKYFNKVKKKLHSKKVAISLAFSTTCLLILVITNKYFDLIHTVSSKRIDILIYTASVILLVFSLSTFIKRTPNFIITISNYSFSIYLLHKVFLAVFEAFNLNYFNPILHVVLAFLFSFFSSILISYLLNLGSFGKYLVGQNQQLKKDFKNERKLAG